MTVTFFILFLAFMILGLPVLFALAEAPLIEVLIAGQGVMISTLFNRINNSLENFTLLALPFFILAGAVMGKGRITERIIGFSQVIVGHVKGSLGHVVILSATLFSALTGSAVAATSAVGNMLIPEMARNGFTRSYAAAVTAAATVLGPIIPPSGIMLIYAFTMNVSVGVMFIGAIIPGLIFTGSLMVLNYFLCIKKGLTLEATAVAVAYALIISFWVYKTIKPSQLFPMFREVAVNASAILLMVSVAAGFAVVVSLSPVSQFVNSIMDSLGGNAYAAFFLVNILLLIIGMFLDAGPAILIFAPILGLALINLGIDPLHFGIVMSINMTIGLITPPMGLVLFLSSDISKVPLQEVVKECIPFIILEVAVIFLISFVPSLCLFLPRLMGF